MRNLASLACAHSGAFIKPVASTEQYATSLSLPAAPEDFVVAAIPINLSIDSNPTFARAAASASMDYLFTSDGPVRPGYLLWQLVDLGWGDTHVIAGPQSLTCIAPPADAPICYPEYFYQFAPLVPITLGEPFAFHIDRSAMTYRLYLHAVNNSSVFRFRLLDSDGVTPVAVELVPEPATLLLVGSAVALVFGRRLRRRQP